jgi:gamma-glutamyltranspeptidase/glutathione hydrolase
MQVISCVADFGLPLRDAVEAPRVHWDGQCIQLEPGERDPEALAALARLAPTNDWPERDLYFGGVHAVVPGEDAAGDPRRGGSAMTVR